MDMGHGKCIMTVQRSDGFVFNLMKWLDWCQKLSPLGLIPLSLRQGRYYPAKVTSVWLWYTCFRIG